MRERVAAPYLPLRATRIWDGSGEGRDGEIEKEPSRRERDELRIEISPFFLKVRPGAEVTGEIKVKGTYITRHCTYEDTWGVRGAEPEERCDAPRRFPLASAAWSHLVRQQAVGDRLEWHPATSRDTVTVTRGSHIPTQRPKLTVCRALPPLFTVATPPVQFTSL